jgi:hypothetical protein
MQFRGREKSQWTEHHTRTVDDGGSSRTESYSITYTGGEEYRLCSVSVMQITLLLAAYPSR